MIRHRIMKSILQFTSEKKFNKHRLGKLTKNSRMAISKKIPAHTSTQVVQQIVLLGDNPGKQLRLIIN